MSTTPTGASPAPSDEGIDPLALRIVRTAGAASLTLATAESLTGGAVVSALVDVPGASACVAGGAACYSYGAKARVLGVDAELLERDGAVTARVAEEMARGALALYGADLAVSTTGVAGPGPDERQVAAGTVFLALARADAEDVRVLSLHLDGDRATVRRASVHAALTLLAESLDGTEETTRA